MDLPATNRSHRASLVSAATSTPPSDTPYSDTVATGPDRSALDAILLPHIELAIWSRQTPTDVQAALLQWAKTASGPVQWRWPAPNAAWMELLAALPPAVATWLEADVHRLVHDMSRWSQRRQLTVVLGPIAHDHCTRFHVDWLPLRLLCTYVGPGTQWIANADVCREALPLPIGPQGHQAGLLQSDGAIQVASAGEVLVAKGHGHPHQVSGLVHRSPRVADPSTPRVVLIISAMPHEVL